MWDHHELFTKPGVRHRPTPTSWWITYAAQHSRRAFDRRAALELPRMMVGEFPSVRVNIITAADEYGLRRLWKAEVRAGRG